MKLAKSLLKLDSNKLQDVANHFNIHLDDNKGGYHRATVENDKDNIYIFTDNTNRTSGSLPISLQAKRRTRTTTTMPVGRYSISVTCDAFSSRT